MTMFCLHQVFECVIVNCALTTTRNVGVGLAAVCLLLWSENRGLGLNLEKAYVFSEPYVGHYRTMTITYSQQT